MVLLMMNTDLLKATPIVGNHEAAPKPKPTEFESQVKTLFLRRVHSKPTFFPGFSEDELNEAAEVASLIEDESLNWLKFDTKIQQVSAFDKFLKRVHDTVNSHFCKLPATSVIITVDIILHGDDTSAVAVVLEPFECYPAKRGLLPIQCDNLKRAFTELHRLDEFFFVEATEWDHYNSMICQMCDNRYKTDVSNEGAGFVRLRDDLGIDGLMKDFNGNDLVSKDVLHALYKAIQTLFFYIALCSRLTEFTPKQFYLDKLQELHGKLPKVETNKQKH